MFDLISIGDCMIDHFFKIEDAHVMCSKNHGSCEICIKWGDKIPVEEYSQMVAGNAANSAVGGARLKLKTAAYINIGGDLSGHKVMDKLKEEGVNTRYVVENKGMDSNTSAVIRFEGERTILVYHQPWKYRLPDLDTTKWVYLTSLSPSFIDTNIISEVTQYLERTGAKLLYNPGTYQMKAGVKKSPKLLALTEVFMVNVEESKRILGIEEDKDVSIKKLLKELADLGPKMVIITDGGEGSYGYDGEKYYHLGVFKAKLLEMTGSGDGFATGVLAGLFHGKDLPEAMRWGAANGASVVEHIGPQAGLLTYSQMMDRLKENSKVVARELK
jgi:ribokinase